MIPKRRNSPPPRRISHIRPKFDLEETISAVAIWYNCDCRGANLECELCSGDGNYLTMVRYDRS